MRTKPLTMEEVRDSEVLSWIFDEKIHRSPGGKRIPKRALRGSRHMRLDNSNVPPAVYMWVALGLKVKFAPSSRDKNGTWYWWTAKK